MPATAWAATRIEASLRIADGLLRAQAIAVHAAGDLDPWKLLWWNRQTRLVRFGCTRSQDIWVHADIPVSDADERGVDRLLGLVIEAVVAVRAHAAGVRASFNGALKASPLEVVGNRGVFRTDSPPPG